MLNFCPQVVSYGCNNGSVRIFDPVSRSVKTLGLHNARITDLKIRTRIWDDESGSEVEIHPIVVSGADDGSLRIWIEGGRNFDCQGHRFKVRQE